MTKTIISTKGAPAAVGPYSQGVCAGNWLYISGQIPLNPETGEMVEGDIAAQTHRVLQNAAAILEASGGTLADVVKVTIYIENLKDFSVVNEIYGSYFEFLSPARSCIEVSGLPKGASIEVDMVAYLG